MIDFDSIHALINNFYMAYDTFYALMGISAFWLFPAAIGYNQARRQNRQVILWTLLCLFLPICVLVILCLPKKKSDDHKISSPYLS